MDTRYLEILKISIGRKILNSQSQSLIMMSGSISIRSVHVYISVLILISASIIAYGNYDGGSNDGQYIQVEKDVYEKSERVRIDLKNDGSASWTPLSQYLKVYREDTGELVYDWEREVAMPAIPENQTLFWDQTDMEGDQVEPGTYRFVLMEKYEAEIVIQE